MIIPGKNSGWCLLLLALICSPGCGGGGAVEPSGTEETAEPGIDSGRAAEPEISCQVTFVELGSVGCIPCRMMQPIMKEIEEEYPEVRVVFYDVRKPEGKKYARKYRLRVIPTQVFLDKDGRELFRHEGFFPKEEIEKVLARGGVAVKGD